MEKPTLYAPSTAKFWDDEHISKGMLAAHLHPGLDSATRNHEFVQRSVAWISGIAPAEQYPQLLDLGCGPGIYAELFDAAGYQVTGIDLSQRSIDYAEKSAKTKGRKITYAVGDYLSLDYRQQFDVATLIYCDFGVLSTENRNTLLKNIYSSLRPNGRLIFDVFTPHQYEGQDEYKNWTYAESGFWSEKPYLCLNSLYRYNDENTFLRQHLIIRDDSVNCYNVWEHTFVKDELIKALADAGFQVIEFYGDIVGSADSPDGNQLCIVAEKTKA